jgi:hypothetical protein
MLHSFGRILQILRCTPAMVADVGDRVVSDRVWSLEEFVDLLNNQG